MRDIERTALNLIESLNEDYYLTTGDVEITPFDFYSNGVTCAIEFAGYRIWMEGDYELSKDALIAPAKNIISNYMNFLFNEKEAR